MPDLERAVLRAWSPEKLHDELCPLVNRLVRLWDMHGMSVETMTGTLLLEGDHAVRLLIVAASDAAPDRDDFDVVDQNVAATLRYLARARRALDAHE